MYFRSHFQIITATTTTIIVVVVVVVIIIIIVIVIMIAGNNIKGNIIICSAKTICKIQQKRFCVCLLA
jgi:hypothetical protein